MAGFQSWAVPMRRWDGQTVVAMNIGTGTRQLAEATMLDTLLRVAADLRDQPI